MKVSKKTKQILNVLDEIEECLDYFTGEKRPYSQQFKEIKQLIEELSIDRKKDHARFAKKLKYIWENQENDE